MFVIRNFEILPRIEISSKAVHKMLVKLTIALLYMKKKRALRTCGTQFLLIILENNLRKIGDFSVTMILTTTKNQGFTPGTTGSWLSPGAWPWPLVSLLPCLLNINPCWTPDWTNQGLRGNVDPDVSCQLTLSKIRTVTQSMIRDLTSHFPISSWHTLYRQLFWSSWSLWFTAENWLTIKSFVVTSNFWRCWLSSLSSLDRQWTSYSWRVSLRLPWGSNRCQFQPTFYDPDFSYKS